MNDAADHGPHGSNARFLLREPWSNVTGWKAVALLIAIASAALGAGVAWSTVTTADRSLGEIAVLEETGRHVLRVVPTGGSAGGRLPGAFCDGLQSIDAVRASYGLVDTDQLRLVTGELVTRQRVTPGVLGYLHREASSAAEPALLIGATIASRLGAVDGSYVRFAADAPAEISSRTSRAGVLASTPRTDDLDDSVIEIVAPTEPVSECRVEPEPSAKAQLAAALPALAPADSDVEVVALRPEIETQDEPDRRLLVLPGDLATRGAAMLAGLVLVAWWYIRRAEWALYRTFGMSTRAMGALAVLEWLIVCAAPMLLGGLWGIAVSTPGAEDVAYRLAGMNLAVAILLTAVAPGLWAAVGRLSSTNLALRGM